MKWFWSCVRAMSDKQQKQLLAFVTSVSRAPYLGFAALQPPFTLRLVGLGDRCGDRGDGRVCWGCLGRRVGVERAAECVDVLQPSANALLKLNSIPQSYVRQWSDVKEKLLTARFKEAKRLSWLGLAYI